MKKSAGLQRNSCTLYFFVVIFAGRPPSYFFLLFAEIPTFSYFLLKFLLFDARRQEEFQLLHVFVLGCWVVLSPLHVRGRPRSHSMCEKSPTLEMLRNGPMVRLYCCQTCVQIAQGVNQVGKLV